MEKQGVVTEMEATKVTSEAYKDVSPATDRDIKQEQEQQTECPVEPSDSINNKGHVKKEENTSTKSFGTKTFLTDNQQMHQTSQDLSSDAASKISSLAQTETTGLSFQCQICDATFPDESHLWSHRAVHLDVDAVKCQTCSRAFGTVEDLSQHQEIHSKDNPFSCDLCGETFRTRKALLKHGKTSHSGGSGDSLDTHSTEARKHTCTYCHKTFKRRGHLVEHERIHTNDKPFDCSKCGMAFTRSNARKKHMMEVHLETKKSYLCSKCNISFQTYFLLVKHKQLHRDRPHSCVVCKKLFPTSKDLQKHLQHPKKDDYTCYICNKKFLSHPKLKKHLGYHKDKPSIYNCEKCKRCFKTASRLQKHRQVHQKLNTHVCRVCQKNFKGVRGLELHMLNHNKAKRTPLASTKTSSLSETGTSPKTLVPTSGNKYSCSICSNTFETYYRMRQHKKMHQERPYMCDTCEETFVYRTDLCQHKNGECADARSCDICNKTFISGSKLQRHKIKHVLERPYLCGICLQPFKTTTQLKAHMLIHTGRKPSVSCQGKKSKRMLDPLSLTSLVSTGDKESTKSGMSVQNSLESDNKKRKTSKLKHKKPVHLRKRSYNCECGRAFKQKITLKQHKLVHKIVHFNLSSELQESLTDQHDVNLPESHIASFSNSLLIGSVAIPVVPPVAVIPSSYSVGSSPVSSMDQPQRASMSSGNLLSMPILDQRDSSDSFHGFACDICQVVLSSDAELDCHKRSHVVTELIAGSIIGEDIQIVHNSPHFGDIAPNSDDREKTRVSDSDDDFGHEDLSNENSELVELSCTAILSPSETSKEMSAVSRTLDDQSSPGSVSHTPADELFARKKCQLVISKLQYFSCGVCKKDFPSRVELNSHESACQDDSSACQDGSSARREGSSARREGSSARRDGSSARRDGSSARRDGSSARRDGSSARRDGSSARRDGSSARRDGSSAHRDGSSARRDGSSARRDGSSTESVHSAVKLQENPRSPVVPGRRHDCSYCGKKCKNQSRLQEHERSHTKEKPFKCKWCDIAFARRHTLKTHVYRNHKERENIHQDWDHETSGQSVSNSAVLDNAEMPINNADTSRVLKKPSLEARRRFRCEHCDKAYLARGHLKEHHIRAHTNIRDFKCRFCSKEFCKKNDWQKHERVHLKQKSASMVARKTSEEGRKVPRRADVHKCNLCRKVFESPAALEQHNTNTHIRNRPYQCDKCDKNYLTSWHLTEHKNRVHLGIREFRCNFCLKEFNKRCNWYKHEELHKKRQGSLPAASIQKLKDKVCVTGESDKGAVAVKDTPPKKCSMEGSNKHQCVVHKCKFCLRIFQSAVMLEEHKRSNHTEDRPYHCDQCNKSYLNRWHLKEHKNRIHSDFKEFKCSFCPKEFNKRSEWCGHESRHKKKQNLVRLSHQSGTAVLASEIAAATKESSDKDSSTCKKPRRVRVEFSDANDQNGNKVPQKASSGGIFIHKCCDCQEEFWSNDVPKDQPTTDKEDCEQCKRMRPWLEILKRHYSQANHHIGRLECCECKKRFCDPHVTRKETEADPNPESAGPRSEYDSNGVISGDNGGHQVSTSANSKASSSHTCRFCSKVFQSLSSLIKHRKTTHTEERRFKCGKCDKKYFAKNHLQEHELRVHNIKKLKGGFGSKESCKRSECQRHEQTSSSEEEEPGLNEAGSNLDKNSVHVELLRCGTCNKMISGKHHMKEHYLRLHSGISLFSCKICGKGFPRSSELAKHEDVHAKLLPPCSLCGLKHLKQQKNVKFGFYSRQMSWCFRSRKPKNASKQKDQKRMRCKRPKHFQCMTCGESFLRMSSFKNHLEVHQVGKKPIFCSLCEKHFVDPRHLQRHKSMFHSFKHSKKLLASSKENPKMCLRCGETFSQRASLISHLSHGHLKQKHLCDLCQVSFATSWRLELHRQQVHPEGKMRLFICKKCNKRFSLRYLLKIHLKLHSTSKVLTCTLCGLEFQTELCLLAHQRAHKRKQFMCDLCGKLYPSKSTLREHLTAHSGVKRFVCERCGKGIRTKSGFRNHLKVQCNVKKEFVCETCGRSFPRKSFLGIHRRSHRDKRRKCKVCKVVCVNQARLTIHMRKHTGERPYACHYCPKRFRFRNIMRDHENIHTGKKPHKCKICGACFASHGSLHHHKRVHNKKESTKGKKTKS